MPTRRLALAIATLSTPALSQALRRPLRIIVPFPPGGAVDSLGRILAERLGPQLNQTVLVENRAGGGGIVGADAVAKGPGDGSMLGIIGAATLLATPMMQAMPFDPMRDLRPLTQITDSAVLCVVNAERARRYGWRSLADVIAFMRANPGQAKLAGSGVGTVSHFTAAAIIRASEVEAIHVPYRGGAETANAALTGEVDLACDLPATLLPLVQGGTALPVTVSAGTRLALLPDVPGFGETPATAGLDIRTWNMMMVPSNTPESEVLRLFNALRRVAAQPEFTTLLARIAYVPVLQDSPAEAASFIAAEAPRWRDLVDLSGARAT